MQKKILTGIACLVLSLSTSVCTAAKSQGEVEAKKNLMQSVQMEGPKDDEVNAEGLSGLCSGIIGDKLILAGGSNFPGNILKFNAKENYSKDIYVATVKPKAKKLSWKKMGELPEGLHSAATAVGKDALYIIGGNNATGDKAACIEIKLDGKDSKQIKCEAISYMPVLISNAGAAVLGDYLYVVGGIQDGKPSGAVYRLNLKGDRSTWELMGYMPEDARIQPLVTAQKDTDGKMALYVWAGFSGWGQGANLCCGGYKYRPDTDAWTGLGAPLKDEKRVYLGGGNLVPVGNDKIYAVGGFDYSVLLDNLRNYDRYPVKHDAAWYKHNQDVYCYNTQTRKWTCVGTVPSLATVHAGIAADDNAIYNIEGEVKPGTNTNVITKLMLK